MILMILMVFLCNDFRWLVRVGSSKWPWSKQSEAKPRHGDGDQNKEAAQLKMTLIGLFSQLQPLG